MRPARATSVLLLVALLSLGAGCGGREAGAGEQADETPTTSPASEAPLPPGPAPASAIGPLPTLGAPTAPPTRPTDTFRRTRVAGVVVPAPDGCLVVRSDAGISWTLVGPLAGPLLARVEVGVRLVVTGRSRPVPEGVSLACTEALLSVESVHEG